MFSTAAIEKNLSKTDRFKNNFHFMQKSEMMEVTKTLMETFTVFDKLCKKHELMYFLVAGSLIGAVREHSLLSWDTDIDLVMPRADYKKIGMILENDAEFSGYTMLFPEHADNFTLAAHFYKKDVYMDDFVNDDLGQLPIYLDILPLENMCDQGVKRFAKGMLIELLTAAYVSRRCFKRNSRVVNEMAKYSWRLRLNLLLRKMIAVLFYFVPKEKFFSLFDKILSDDNEYDYVAIPFGAKRFFGEIYHRDIFFPVSTAELDGKMFMAPNQANKYLEQRYGDYMVQPSESEILEQLLIAKRNSV